MGHYADDREKISEIKNRGFYNGGKAMSETKGRVTIPTDLDVIPETLKMLDEWGADAIRDCDGTEFPAGMVVGYIDVARGGSSVTRNT